MAGITFRNVERYIDGLEPERDALTRRMEDYAAEHDVPIIGPVAAHFLALIAQIQRAERILEAGTAIGYTARWFADATAPWNGRITTLEADPDMADLARANLEEAGVSGQVEIVVGDALASLGTLEGPFDLCFIDHEKEQYRDFLEQALPKVRPGGVVVADNVLREGEVAEPEGGDAMVRAMRTFNPFAMAHPELDGTIVPLRDGLFLATKAA